MSKKKKINLIISKEELEILEYAMIYNVYMYKHAAFGQSAKESSKIEAEESMAKELLEKIKLKKEQESNNCKESEDKNNSSRWNKKKNPKKN